MKTKFIEGTNKQYSIREDGEVIRHYKYTWTRKKTYKEGIMPKYGKNKTHVTINDLNSNKNGSFSINTLLRKYFNTFKCVQCSIIKPNNFKRSCVCNECLKNNVSSYNKRTRSKYRESNKLSCKKAIENLKPYYVAGTLRGYKEKYVSHKLLDEKIIESKRQQLLLHRTIKTIQNEHSGKH